MKNKESAVIKWFKEDVFIRKSKPVGILDICGGFRGCVFNDCGVKYYTPYNFRDTFKALQNDFIRQRELLWYNVPSSELNNKY